MSRLDLKIPPDVVWVIVAGLMWTAARATPRLVVPFPLRAGIGTVLTMLGVAIIIGARKALERAKTTWGPMTPERTTSLVTAGVYSFSRHPMYLGMLLVMLAWAALLASPTALMVSGVFVLYIDRFQIAPEERVLSAILGREYLDYRTRVRRWA